MKLQPPLLALMLLLAACSSNSGPITVTADLPDVHTTDALDSLASVDQDQPREVTPDLPRADHTTDSADLTADLVDLTDSEGLADLNDLPDTSDLTDARDILELADAPDTLSPPEVVDAVDLADLPAEPDLTDVQPDLPPDLIDITPELPPDIPPEPDCIGFPDSGPEPPAGQMLTPADFVMVGKAEPDETWLDPENGEHPKTNEAYVWALAKEQSRVWIGTVANTLCMGFTGFGGANLGYQTDNAICDEPVPGQLFPDWRIPHIHVYDEDTGAWTTMTAPEGTEQAPGIAHETHGWRAAIGVDDYLLMAGPGTGLLWGMPGYGTSMVLFKDGQYLGAHKYEDHNDARKFEAYGGNVYLGSWRWDGKGVILRWNRDESAPPDSLFEFTEVGVISGSAAWLTGYRQRLYAITWPTGAGATGFEVWRSPKIPPCGLTEEHQEQWEQVFAYSDYDANPDTAKLGTGGAMVVFQDQLYFGSMHVPFAYSCSDPGNLITCALEKYINTHALSLFRLTEETDDGAVEVECLFGQDKGGLYPPQIGPPGFGNHYNNYLWTLAVHDGWLYAGTMDYSLFLVDALGAYGLPGNFPGMVPPQQHGFDIFATADGQNWVPVTANGFGNPYNWGARNLLHDGETLWLGTGNPFNLNPNGGWELWQGE